MVIGNKSQARALLKKLLDGTATIPEFNWFQYNISQRITRNLGSVKLRRVVNAVQLGQRATRDFTEAELDYVAREILYIATHYKDRRPSKPQFKMSGTGGRIVPAIGQGAPTPSKAYRHRLENEEELKGIHPDLIAVVRHMARNYQDVPIRVADGLRTVAEQKSYVAKGTSKTMNSPHLTGYAVDLWPIPTNWKRWSDFAHIASLMQKAAKDLGVPIVWGGTFSAPKDGPHFELNRRVYNWRDRSYSLRKVKDGRAGSGKTPQIQLMSLQDRREPKRSSRNSDKVPVQQARAEWVEATWQQLQRLGSQDLKLLLTTRGIIDMVLRYEIGTGTVIPTISVNSSGYCGPFQFGPGAWLAGARRERDVIQVPLYDRYPWGSKKYREGEKEASTIIQTATKEAKRGGPADVNAAPRVVIHFWNGNLSYLNRHPQGGLVPRTPEFLYLMHNQGAAGTVSQVVEFKRSGDKGVFFRIGNQSRDAHLFASRIAQQLNRA